jgi:hypothetical protein
MLLFRLLGYYKGCWSTPYSQSGQPVPKKDYGCLPGENPISLCADLGFKLRTVSAIGGNLTIASAGQESTVTGREGQSVYA